MSATLALHAEAAPVVPQMSGPRVMHAHTCITDQQCAASDGTMQSTQALMLLCDETGAMMSVLALCSGAEAVI